MIIGVPKEIKREEYRVGLVPAGVKVLVESGHKVLVTKEAGIGSGIPDEAYVRMDATMIPTNEEVYSLADMIIKVKEPIESEYNLLKPNQILFTYLHLAAVPELCRVLLEREVSSVAYETIELPDRSLPLLKPMSEIAGKMAIQVGATCLEKENGGKGILLGGVPGVKPARVTIIGGGTVGTNAAKIAVGMGAVVTVLDKDLTRLTYLDDIFGGRLITVYSDVATIEENVLQSDLVVGAVLITGAKAPKLVSEELVSRMSPGSVVVDVSVDQGGCIETCKPTTHDNPTFIKHGVVHYCVANMPGAVARSSTFALTNVTIQYAKKLADLGFTNSVKEDAALAKGVNTYKGKMTHAAVADSLGYEYHPLDTLL